MCEIILSHIGQETLQRSMDVMKEKVEILLGGENEANKLIDSIVPNLASIEAQVS
jgi:hypothetical protein